MELLRIESKEDIDALYDKCMASDKESIDVTVEYVYDPREFIRSGFLPHNTNFSRDYIDYANGVGLDVIKFWSPHHKLDDLEDHEFWFIAKMEYYAWQARTQGNGFGFILYQPNLLYSSMRPKTDMAMFRGPNSRTASRRNLKNGRVIIDNKVWNYIHVTRYAQGMSKGLFFGSEPPPGTCGTFYYSEPESNTILVYRTSKTYFNKTVAAEKLMVSVSNNDEADKYVKQLLLDHAAGRLPADMKMTPLEFSKTEYWEEDGVDPASIPQVPRYVGDNLFLYAAEDVYDQGICKKARRLGYDIVILTHMIGSHQVVAEVLDTRDRADSFKSLVYLID